MSRNTLVIVAVLGFLALHQDVWFWDDDKTLFLGFLPVGLAYHVVYTIGLAVFWWAVVILAWPQDLESLSEGGSENEDQG